VTLHNRPIRVLLTLHTFYFVLIGALDLLCVVLALNFLHMGPGGPGYLNSALAEALCSQVSSLPFSWVDAIS